MIKAITWGHKRTIVGVKTSTEMIKTLSWGHKRTIRGTKTSTELTETPTRGTPTHHLWHQNIY